jgi:hypothetical protein
MTLDEDSGVWSVTGEAGWDRDYYLFEVEVFVPSTGRWSATSSPTRTR